MSTQNRIIEIDHDSYVLPESMTDSDMLKLMQLMPLLMKARRICDRLTYIPDKDSEYAEKVIVADGRPMKVCINITCDPIHTREAYDILRKQGQAIYDAAHPKQTPFVSDATIAEVKALERNQPTVAGAF